MARSAANDPIEKFRFRVTVIAIDLNAGSIISTIGGLSASGTALNAISVITNAGFSSVTLPKASVKSIKYRENIDNQRFSQIPGLVSYEPVTLRKGVTKNRDFYDWYRLVNEELSLLNVAGELSKDSKLTPAQFSNFRKDVIIEVLNREGEPIKAWYLFNAWPSGYTPGDDLDASSETKLIQEITLTYEMFLELEGGPDGFLKEMAKSGVIIAANSLLSKFGLGGLRGTGGRIV